MNLLKEFETLKSPLLKNWEDDEKIFNIHKKSAMQSLKINLDNNLIYEAGAKKPSYTSEYYLSLDEIEALFGLPYTSTGSYAAIWNTNTQARAKYGKKIYFKGVARNEKKEIILIFEEPQKNKVEKHYYFADYEFLHYQEECKKMQAAIDWGEFVKDCKQITNDAAAILNTYTGKAYGEKTKKAIAEKINNLASCAHYSAYLYSDYSQYIKINSKKNNFEMSIYFKYLDKETNKIIKIDKVETIPEHDTRAEYNETLKLKAKIKKVSSELLELVEAYNKHAANINQYSKATDSVFSFDLKACSEGRL